MVGAGDDKLYPSRSELARVALRQFLCKKLKYLKHTEKYPVEIDDSFNKIDNGIGTDVVLPDGNGNHIKYVVKEVLDK